MKSRESTKKGSAPRIQAITRAGHLLDLIAAQGPEGIGIAELSRQSGLHKTTAFHILATLEDLGFVSREQNSRKYRLGLKNLELGSVVRRQLQLRDLVYDSLLRLCSETRETVNFAQPLADRLMIIECIEGSHGLRAAYYVGSHSHYHATACGKAMLAYLPEIQRRHICEDRPLPALTGSTVTDVAALYAQLDSIRQGGPALDLEENEVGACCIGRAILSDSGNVLGAISISGLSGRFDDAARARIDTALKREIDLISKKLRGS